MARLEWNAVGERFYEIGIDHGVLYIGDQGFAWPGLISVSESPTGGEARPYYIDGIKYVNISAAEEFEATLAAFHSPPEFGPCDGTVSVHNGLFATQQPRKQFSLSYRTKIGNDIDGVDHAYKIHLVYGALAGPSEVTNATMSDSIDLTSKSWSITTLPPRLSGIKPTAHFEIDTRTTPDVLLEYIEDILYGTQQSTARLLPVNELYELFAGFASLRLVSIGPDIWEIYETDEAPRAFTQSTRPIPADVPTLWFDTSEGDYAIPRLVTGD